VEQDVCFKVDVNLNFHDLSNLIVEELGKVISDYQISLKTLDIFMRQEDQAHKQITFRVRISSFEKTLSNAEVNQIISDLGNVANQRFGAEII